MQKRNKLLDKVLLTECVASGVFALIAGASAFMLGKIVKQGNEIQKEYQQEVLLNPNVKRPELDSTGFFLCIALILICGFLTFNSQVIIRDRKQEAYKIGKKYLMDLLKQSKEQTHEKNTIKDTHIVSERTQIINAMREFEEIFQDERALTAVINTICNSLTNEEQKAIVQIVREFDSMPLEKSKKVLAETRNKIFDVVKQHESIDPDFTRKIWLAMATAHKTYVLSANQMTR